MPNPEKKIYPFDLIHDEMIFSLTSIKNGLDTLSTAQPYSIHGEPQIYTGLKNLTIGLERYLQTALIFVHYKQGKPLKKKDLKEHSKNLISLYNAVVSLMREEDNFSHTHEMNEDHGVYVLFSFLSDFNASQKEFNFDAIFDVEKINASQSYLQKTLAICDFYFSLDDLYPAEKSLYKSLKKEKGNSTFIDSNGNAVPNSELKMSQFRFEKAMCPIVKETLCLIGNVNFFLHCIGRTEYFETEEHDYASFINGQILKSPALTFLRFH